MPSKRCPSCGLVNPERTMVCDCGWSFDRNEQGAPMPGVGMKVTHDQAQGISRGSAILIRIVVAIVVGVIVGAIKYSLRH